MATGPAIVTGSGGTGCGRAIALRLAEAGYRIVVSDINSSGGNETVRLIETAGGQATFRFCDVADPGNVRELIESHPDLGLLVNNASAPFKPGDAMDHWVHTVQTDFLGALYATRFAIEAMRRSGSGGAIVNIASISGLWHGRRYPGTSAPGYDSAKMALIRLTTSLANLASTDNIRVNCLAPGWIDTDGPRQYWESLTPEERVARGVPARLLKPAEIAEAVMRLASDASLAGRILAWWSDDAPRLIDFADRGYEGFSK